MLYISDSSDNNTRFDVIDCLSNERQSISRTCLEKYFEQCRFISNTYSSMTCIEVLDENELRELKKDYANKHPIEHEEDGRFFLLVQKEHVALPIVYYTLGISKQNGEGPWKLFILHKTGKGVTQKEDLMYKTADRQEAYKKMNSINKYLKYGSQYKVYEFSNALKIIENDNKRW